MTVFSKKLRIKTRFENDVVDLTEDVRKVVEESGLTRGTVTVFVSGSTAAVTTLEFEPGLVKDFPGMLNRVSPKEQNYEHQKTWNDDNGQAHVKAALVGPSLTVPFNEGALDLGVWQQVVLVELDTRPRDRTVVLQMVGE